MRANPLTHSTASLSDFDAAPVAGRAGDPTPVFGVSLAQVPIAFPAGQMLEYLPEVDVFPLPLAPARLLGLIQLRGHPMGLFDGCAEPPGRARRVAALVVGAPGRAAALRVDQAPRALCLADTAAADTDPSTHELDTRHGASVGTRHSASVGTRLSASATPPQVDFAQALGAPLVDTQGVIWWTVDPERLFELLAGPEPAAVPADKQADEAPVNVQRDETDGHCGDADADSRA